MPTTPPARFEDLPILFTLTTPASALGPGHCERRSGTIAELLELWNLDNPNELALMAQVLRHLKEATRASAPEAERCQRCHDLSMSAQEGLTCSECFMAEAAKAAASAIAEGTRPSAPEGGKTAYRVAACFGKSEEHGSCTFFPKTIDTLQEYVAESVAMKGVEAVIITRQSPDQTKPPDPRDNPAFVHRHQQGCPAAGGAPVCTCSPTRFG
jgi:hypothetical protein